MPASPAVAAQSSSWLAD